MQDIAPEVVAIADACLGGLRGRSALLVGPEERRKPYRELLAQAGMQAIFQEDTPYAVSSYLPRIQLLISMPEALPGGTFPQLNAASIAQGCEGRRTPLLVFDLAATTSVDELAGLLPAVCLYTPDDLRRILTRIEAKAS